MKRFVCLFVCLFVCGCDSLYGRINTINVYYENLYTYEQIENKEYFIKKAFLKEGNLFATMNWKPDPEEFVHREDYYQDKDGRCFLFSYDKPLKMKIDVGFDPDDSNTVFMIGKNGIKVVSREEYERLKPTFIPHPYDPSLCKSKL